MRFAEVLTQQPPMQNDLSDEDLLDEEEVDTWRKGRPGKAASAGRNKAECDPRIRTERRTAGANAKVKPEVKAERGGFKHATAHRPLNANWEEEMDEEGAPPCSASVHYIYCFCFRPNNAWNRMEISTGACSALD